MWCCVLRSESRAGEEDRPARELLYGAYDLHDTQAYRRLYTRTLVTLLAIRRVLELSPTASLPRVGYSALSVLLQLPLARYPACVLDSESTLECGRLAGKGKVNSGGNSKFVDEDIRGQIAALSVTRLVADVPALPPALLLLLPADAVDECASPGDLIPIVNEPSPLLSMVTAKSQGDRLKARASVHGAEAESLALLALDIVKQTLPPTGDPLESRSAQRFFRLCRLLS